MMEKIVKSNASDYLLINLDEQEEISLVIEESGFLKVDVVGIDSSSSRKFLGKASLKDNARLELNVVDFASSSIDFDFDVELVNDSHFESNIGTISSLEGHKKYDVKVLQDGERSYSYVKMYGVKTDDSDLELLGTTTIKRGAKKSFTSEEGTIVNLASKGKCQVSPILKIDENDIKASHSAKLGKVSEDVLFYMMSRGLDIKKATLLLTYSYLKPINDKLRDDGYKAKLISLIEKKEN